MYVYFRCKPRRKNVREKSENFSTACVLSPGYNPQKIMKLLRQTCFVSDGYSSYGIHLTKASDEALLRKRIQELQTYRRLGLSTSADIEKYEADHAKRVSSYLNGCITVYECFYAADATQSCANT